tara:strand:- start:8266 stop:8385 length:120 start_codon:yes stop_codon:yes gene_type:complete
MKNKKYTLTENSTVVGTLNIIWCTTDTYNLTTECNGSNI